MAGFEDLFRSRKPSLLEILGQVGTGIGQGFIQKGERDRQRKREDERDQLTRDREARYRENADDNYDLQQQIFRDMIKDKERQGREKKRAGRDRQRDADRTSRDSHRRYQEYVDKYPDLEGLPGSEVIRQGEERDRATQAAEPPKTSSDAPVRPSAAITEIVQGIYGVEDDKGYPVWPEGASPQWIQSAVRAYQSGEPMPRPPGGRDTRHARTLHAAALELKKDHPDWDAARIADELRRILPWANE